MVDLAVYALVYLGSALMVYNIYGFIRFARYVNGRDHLEGIGRILVFPIVLLVMFLLGYLIVGVFGNPDIVMSGILFGGSIFVFIMYRMLFSVTEQIVQREQLEAELMAAEKSNRAKSSFLASISHEMRTPMNVILGLDELALKNPDLSDQTRDQLTKIGLSARHLSDIINNILEMNEIESGQMVAKHEEFSLRELLDQISAIVGTLCEEKGLSYQLTVDDAIAEHYVGDEMRIKQIMVSMLDNAVKYTDAPGSVTCTAEVVEAAESSETSAQQVRLSVTDTGIGMDPDFLPQLFSVFALEDASSTNRYGGSGLSLAIAKRMVEGMGGSIAVASQKNVGSTFTVVLPLDRAELRSDEPPVDEAAAPSLEGRCILIVEDVEENAEIVADLLELEGATSERAENGQVAVDMWMSMPPHYYDAVLMDLRMPIMDGLEAARRIRATDRADAKTIPIIALTANAFESDVQQTIEAGMNAHLAKPVDVDLLYATIASFLQAASQ